MIETRSKITRLNIEERAMVRRLLERGRPPEAVSLAFGASFWQVLRIAQDAGLTEVRHRKAGA